MKKKIKKIYKNIPFKKHVFYLFRWMKIPNNLTKHLYFEDIFKVKFSQYSFLIRHYGFQLENEIFWRGLTNGWEKISIKLWIELSKKSSVILDIGANTGIYSLISKSVSPSSKVIAFEPVTRVYQKLNANISLNNFDIITAELAVSNLDGEAIIYDAPTEHVYSVTVNKNLSGLKDTIETKIKTQKLSSYIKQHQISHIDLIKIDVETHEPEVLEGMEEFLFLFKPTLLIEILNADVADKIQNLIADINYLYFNIDEVNSPKLVSKLGKSDFYNFLICSPEIAKELKLIE
jgi:FkbM family methyltransferase